MGEHFWDGKKFVQISCCRSKFSKQPTEWKLRLTTRGSKGNISGQCLSSRISTGLSKLFNGRSLDWHRNKTQRRGRGQRETGKLEVLISKWPAFRAATLASVDLSCFLHLERVSSETKYSFAVVEIHPELFKQSNSTDPRNLVSQRYWLFMVWEDIAKNT